MKIQIVLLLLSLALATGSAAQTAAPPVPAMLPPAKDAGVWVFMIDMANTMTGCANCVMHPKTEDVMGLILERIVSEVRRAPKPLDVYIAPFARQVLDFDGSGPFDPWRKFTIAGEDDVKAFAEYLDPQRWGPPGEAPASKLLPVYGKPNETQLPWPGFYKICAESQYFEIGVYNSIMEGLNFLRDLTPDGAEDKAAYVASHYHRLTAYADGVNSIKTASFAHVLQTAELHRSDMDGRFWLTKVYAFIKSADADVEKETQSDKAIAGDSQGLYLAKLPELPSVSDLLVLDDERPAYTEGLKDPKKYETGVMKIPFPQVKITGAAARLRAQTAPSMFDKWPDGAGFSMAVGSLESPFDKIATAFEGSITGVTALLKSGLSSAVVRVGLAAEGAEGAPRPMFLASGAPEMSFYWDLGLAAPTGTVKIKFQPPGSGGAVSQGPNLWDLGKIAMRTLRGGRFGEGVVEMTGDQYVLPGENIKVIFDPALMRVTTDAGKPVANGDLLDLVPLKIFLLPPPEPGVYTVDCAIETAKSNIVFEKGAARNTARFRYQAKSDWPYYMLLGALALALLAGLGFLAVRLLFTPPKISRIGGRLVMVRGPQGIAEEEKDLGACPKSRFTVGAGAICDWALEAPHTPFIAFEIVLRSKENRLRIQKTDAEVEDVKLNGNEMAQSFLKDGDRIELAIYEFVYKRS